MKNLFFLLTVCGFFGLAAAELPKAPGNPPPPPQQPGDRMGRRNAALSWRAFSKLTPEERKELMKLQRTQPDEFRKKLKELADKALAEEKAKREALRKIVNEYRNTQNAERKKELAKESEKTMRQDYMTRLQEHRRHLEEMKQRAAKMEAELNRREQKAEDAIKARLNFVLDGGDPFAPPRRPNRGK